MTLSISKLHSNGSVTLEFGSSEASDILFGEDTGDYPLTFRSALQSAWDKEGWAHQYDIIVDAATASTMINAIDATPPGWTFGHPHAYVGDGFLLCPSCVMKQVEQGESGIDSEQMSCELFVYQETPASGDSCDQCYQYIPGAEPHCLDCGSTENTLESNSSGELMLCRPCLAAALVRAREYGADEEYRMRANLVGVNAYHVVNHYYAGYYGKGAYAATR